MILLSSAPMEIADSGVNTLWYLLPALFWAVLWRPRTRAGTAVAAAVGFFAAASTSLAVLFLPLLAMRVFVLRLPGRHHLGGPPHQTADLAANSVGSKPCRWRTSRPRNRSG